MSTSHTQRLMRASCSLLSEIGPVPREVRVEITAGGTTLRLVGAPDLEPTLEEVGPTPRAYPVEGVPPGALWLSEEEAAIIRALPESGFWSTRRIAEAVGMQPGGDIRVLLRNMRNRGLIDGEQGRGFGRVGA